MTEEEKLVGQPVMAKFVDHGKSYKCTVKMVVARGKVLVEFFGLKKTATIKVKDLKMGRDLVFETSNSQAFIPKVYKHFDPSGNLRCTLPISWFLNDVVELIAGQAGRLTRMNQKAKLSWRDVQTVTELILPSKLAKFAVAEGKQVLTKYTSSKSLAKLTSKTKG